MAAPCPRGDRNNGAFGRFKNSYYVVVVVVVAATDGDSKQGRMQTHFA